VSEIICPRCGSFEVFKNITWVYCDRCNWKKMRYNNISNIKGVRIADKDTVIYDVKQ